MEFSCPQCVCVFPTHQQLSLHMVSKHKISNHIHMYVNTVYCPICLTYFHNRESVLNHLRYRAHACRLAILASGPVLSLEESKAMAETQKPLNAKVAHKGKKRGFKPEPAFRMPGPRNLLYFLRFGTIWHSSMKRSRVANKSHCNSVSQSGTVRNTYGVSIFNTYFSLVLRV